MNGQRAEHDEGETQEKTCAKDALAQQRARMDASSVGKQLWRLAVTGRRDMRVRDFVRVPRVVKQIDKYSFTLGVAGVVLSHHLVIVAPELFWAWYSASISSLLSHRLWSYRRKKWSALRLRSVAQQSPASPDSTKDKETLCRHYFMLDFCYYANALCLLNIFLLPSSTALFMVNFCFSNGPLLLVRSLTLERSTQHPLARSALNASLPSQALVAWRNSLVFHDIDKVTSVFLHALPSLLSWCWRWHGLRTLITERSSSDESNVKSAFFYVPLSAYLLWQFAYLTWTEVVAKEKLDSDPDLITSLRWLAADDKQPMNRMATKALRRVRILGPYALGGLVSKQNALCKRLNLHWLRNFAGMRILIRIQRRRKPYLWLCSSS
jgi:hypothetical protein